MRRHFSALLFSQWSIGENEKDLVEKVGKENGSSF